MESRSHALVAGLFVLLLSCAGVLMVWWVSGKGEETRDYYLVTRKAVSGLNPQAQVRYRGMRAGKVEAIEVDGKDRRNILVRISLDASIALTRSTTAQLALQGVTGMAYVMLDDAGESAEPLVAAAGELPRIPLKPTLIDALSEQAVTVSQQLSEIAARANRLLDDRSVNNISRTLDNIAAASDGLKELPALLVQIRQVLSDENVKRMSRMLTNLEATSAEAAPLAAELHSLVSSMQTLSQRLDGVVAEAGGELTTRTLPDLNVMVRDMQRNSRQLQEILNHVERAPQSLIFGRPTPQPGPGEAGFSAPQ